MGISKLAWIVSRDKPDLIYRKGTWYLAVTLDVPEPTLDEPTGNLGVDLGIVNMAADSEGETFSGEHVGEEVRQRHMTCVNACKSEARSPRNGISKNSPARKPDSAKTPIMSSANGLCRKPKPTGKE